MTIKAILLMGGAGERFGSQVPKQFHRLSGKKIYTHCLERFLESGLFVEIILVTPEKWLTEVVSEVNGYKNVKVVKGGNTRQESSYFGLLACEGADYVVIHDAVRPFITPEILKANVEGAKKHGAVDTCIPSADTLIQRNGEQIQGIPKRSDYMRGQTPQSFVYPLILEAHQKTKLKNASDDCQLVIEQGNPVFIVPGAESNIKITTELDLFLAEQLFRLKQTPSSAGSLSLKGKRFAITGGTGGIGRAVVELLKQEGAEALVISPSSTYFPTDLTSAENAKEIFEKIDAIDGLINCLGRFHLNDLKNHTDDEICKVIAVNLTGLIFSCKYAKIRGKGHIINIASSSYSKGRKDYSIYSSTKAAVVNFTQALVEERPDLFVNVVAPQRTHTSMREQHFPNEDPQSLLSPEQVAHAIINLLKQELLTGTLLEVKTNII